MGLRGDMRLETASGRKEIRLLAEELADNPESRPIVFVWTGSRLFIDEIDSVSVLGHQQLFDVELDDGEVIKASASSQFVLRSGGRKIAPELVEGESLLPLYLSKDEHGYPAYHIPGKEVKRKISRLMAEWVLGRPLGPGTYVEHIDGNRQNYHPDNLEITVDEFKAKRSFKPQIVKAVEEAQKLFDECSLASPKMAKIVGSRRKKKKGNHKVVRITPGLVEEVYAASVRFGGSVSVSGVFLTLPS